MANYYFKLGLSHYTGIEDKNSGLHEYNIIAKELNKLGMIALKTVNAITYNFDCHDTLVIISGVESNRTLEALKNNIDRTGVKTVLVLTDLRVYNKLPILQHIRFDLVLTQTHKDIALNTNSQMYSYVPELFLNNDDKYNFANIYLKKHNEVFFGGTIDGRLDSYMKYIQGNKNVFCLYKQGDKDNRMEYYSFQQLQKDFRYVLIFSDTEYEENGWVTARFVEALNNLNIPLVDANYDKFEHFISKDSPLIVSDQIDLVDIKMNINTRLVLDELNKIKAKVSCNRNNFALIIKTFINYTERG